ncbi:LysR family transcriptional regulator [Pseudorhodoplanes sp.]|uniref:LysR family transcriptional regulator n=1 Tax=Pseudorhodoplanes sp. TaxID=1934341 RepID=UPI003D1111AB
MLDPKLVIQVLAIAQTGSISRAAETLGISQPALSNSVANLERALGVRLLERSRQGSRLNHFGITVSRYASAVNSTINAMIDEVRVQSAGGTGSIAIGVTPIAAAMLVPEAASSLTNKVPHLEINIIEGADDMLLGLLLEAKIELSVGPIGVDFVPNSIGEIPLQPDPFALVVRPNHPLATSKSLSLRDLIHEQWILPDKGTALRRQIEAMFLVAGLRIPQYSINTSSSAMFEELLLRTDRISIMSQTLMSRTNCAGFVCIPLKEAGSPRLLGIKHLHRNAFSPIAIDLIEELKQAAANAKLSLRNSKRRS